MATELIKIAEAASRFPQLGHERIRQLAAGGLVTAQRGADGGWLVDPANIETYIAKPKRAGGRPRKDQGAPTGPANRPQDLEAARYYRDRPPLVSIEDERDRAGRPRKDAPAPVVVPLPSPMCPVCGQNPAGVGGVPCGDCMARANGPAPVDPITGDRPETANPSPQAGIVLGIMAKIAAKLGADYFHVTGEAAIRGNWFTNAGHPRRPAIAPVMGVPLTIPGPASDDPQALEAWRRDFAAMMGDPGFDFVAWLAAQQDRGFDVQRAALAAVNRPRDIVETMDIPGDLPLGDYPHPDPLLAATGFATPGVLRQGELLEAPPSPAPALLEAATATDAPPAGVWQLGDKTRCACPGCGHAKMGKHHYQNGRIRCTTCIVAGCRPGAPNCHNVPKEDLLDAPDGDGGE